MARVSTCARQPHGTLARQLAHEGSELDVGAKEPAARDLVEGYDAPVDVGGLQLVHQLADLLDGRRREPRKLEST